MYYSVSRGFSIRAQPIVQGLSLLLGVSLRKKQKIRTVTGAARGQNRVRVDGGRLRDTPVEKLWGSRAGNASIIFVVVVISHGLYIAT